MAHAMSKKVSSRSVPQNPPNILQLVEQLEEYIESFVNPVFHQAMKAPIAQIKECLADWLVRRVRIRSIDQLQQVSNGMFRKLSERGADVQGCAETNRKSASLYRSVVYLDSVDYFDRPFISQMATHRDIAVEHVAREQGRKAKELITIQRVIIIPEHRWNSDNTAEFQNWWKSVSSKIDNLQSESKPDGWILCVSEAVLTDTGNLDDFLDFGLYGTVAVGAYRRLQNGEELCLCDSDSELFLRCERMWDRLLHFSSKPIEWGEFKRRLGLEVIG